MCHLTQMNKSLPDEAQEGTCRVFGIHLAAVGLNVDFRVQLAVDALGGPGVKRHGARRGVLQMLKAAHRVLLQGDVREVACVARRRRLCQGQFCEGAVLQGLFDPVEDGVEVRLGVVVLGLVAHASIPPLGGIGR
jgi:hypothetical protein